MARDLRQGHESSRPQGENLTERNSQTSEAEMPKLQSPCPESESKDPAGSQTQNNT